MSDYPEYVLYSDHCALLAERDALLRDWNALVATIGAPTNGGAVGHAAALKADRDRLAAELSALRAQLLEHAEVCKEGPHPLTALRAELSAARALATELCMQHCGKAYYGPCISTDCPRRTAPSAGAEHGV